MGFIDELKSRNFSIYAQLLSCIAILLSLILGIINLFHANLIIIFAILVIVFGVVLLFIEVGFLTRICPTSEKFDSLIGKVKNNWPRAALYLVFAIVTFLSTIVKTTSLVAVGVLYLLVAICYGIAAASGQQFVSSKALGSNDNSVVV